MKKRKVLAAVLVFGISIQVLASCTAEEQTGIARAQVGVACYNQSDIFISELLDCFEEKLNQLEKGSFEATVTVRDGAGSQRIQNDQVKELVDAGCNVLCVNLVDRADPSEIIDIARENDIPIIFFNREPVAEDMMQWDKLYYVGADAKQSGVMQGELAADAIETEPQIDRNKDGKIQYVVLEGEPGHQDAIIRTENAVDTLRGKGVELEKLSYGIANWNQAQAENRMLQMIGQHQNQIQVLRKHEFELILLKHFHKLPEVNSFQYYRECLKWLKKINIITLQKEVMQCLKTRTVMLVENNLEEKVPYELRYYAYFSKKVDTNFQNIDAFWNARMEG